MTAVVLLTSYGGISAPPAFTWNPLDMGTAIMISNGNRTATKTGANAYSSLRSTLPMPDGGYVEVLAQQGNTSPFMMVGLANAAASMSNHIGASTNGWAYYQQTGEKYTNNVATAYGASFAAGDVIGIAYKNGKLYFAKNNTWQGGGDPVAETGEAFSGLTGTLYVGGSLFRGTSDVSILTIRAAAAQQSYSPPTGYTAPG